MSAICVVFAGNASATLKNNVAASQSQRAGILHLCFYEVPQVRIVYTQMGNALGMMGRYTCYTAFHQCKQESFVLAYSFTDTSL